MKKVKIDKKKGKHLVRLIVFADDNNEAKKKEKKHIDKTGWNK